MTSWMKNQLTKLYNAVSAPVAATRDVLAERLQSVCETTSLFYNKMMEDTGYEQERLKEIVEKEAEEQEQQQEQEEDIDLTPHKHERALKGAYRSFVIPNTPTHQDVNRKPAKGNGVYKDNHDPMRNMKEAYKATH